MTCERCTEWELANGRPAKEAVKSAYGLAVCQTCYQEAVRIAKLVCPDIRAAELEEEQRQEAIRRDQEDDWMRYWNIH